MSASKVEDFLTAAEEAAVIEAIRMAEKNTSGEIRVHLETSAVTPKGQKMDAFERAAQVFDLLHMNNTKNSNGVLLYVAVEDRTFVILGDTGINKVVPSHFWESTKEAILSEFKKGNIKQGLVDGILMAGEQLKAHFPYEKGDINELPNEISTQ
ncbi:MAG: TPM domain-containing protein [Flavobacteriaceae bacterium]